MQHQVEPAFWKEAGDVLDDHLRNRECQRIFLLLIAGRSNELWQPTREISEKSLNLLIVRKCAA